MSNNYYETSDLGLAASLSASGFRVSGTDRSNSRSVIFLFDDSPELEAATQRFWTGELKLSATVLLDHIRLLKTRIYGAEL